MSEPSSAAKAARLALAIPIAIGGIHIFGVEIEKFNLVNIEHEAKDDPAVIKQLQDERAEWVAMRHAQEKQR
jgi:hypothetical protein